MYWGKIIGLNIENTNIAKNTYVVLVIFLNIINKNDKSEAINKGSLGNNCWNNVPVLYEGLYFTKSSLYP